ncbi:MAG: ATP-binding protein, partial [Bdellovibrionota bacterium]
IHVRKSIKRPGILHATAERYLELILAREGASARELILSEVLAGKSVRWIYQRVLEPVLNEIGLRWLENTISVGEEHYCTAITQSLLISLHAFVRPLPGKRGRVLFAGVQSELHDLGLRMVADLLEMDGWETIYYGPNLPSEAICSAAEKVRPELVAISVTTPAHLIETREVIRRVRALKLIRPVSVLVGGYAFILDPSLYVTVGADACATNGAQAVRVARDLEGRRQGFLPVLPEQVKSLSGSPSPLGRHKTTATEELLRLMSELSALHRQLAKRNAAIEALQEEKNRFLGMAAHDLRNAVQVILSGTRILAKTGDGLSETKKKLVEIVESSAVSMAELIDSYLDVSRIEAGKLELHREAVDLVSLVEERMAVARLLSEKAGVRIRRSGAEGPVVANIDSARICQALDNLLLNAVKFSPKGGEVEVAMKVEGENSVISVIDQGPGIAPQRAKQLFTAFSPLSTGTGLGLHIAKRVLEAHGGRIWHEGHSPHGCSFSMAFPLEQVHGSEAAA